MLYKSTGYYNIIYTDMCFRYRLSVQLNTKQPHIIITSFRVIPIKTFKWVSILFHMLITKRDSIAYFFDFALHQKRGK